MTEPVEVLKGAYAAWKQSRGAGVDDWLAILAPDAKLGSLAEGAPGAEFSQGGEGHEAVRRYLERLNADWEMITFDMDDYIADGDRVAVMGHCSWRNRQSGRVISTKKADFWRFRGGKVVEFFEFYDTAEVRGLT